MLEWHYYYYWVLGGVCGGVLTVGAWMDVDIGDFVVLLL